MLRLVQLIRADGERLVAIVDKPSLRPLTKWRSVYELAAAAIAQGHGIAQIVSSASFGEPVPYDAVYEGRFEWKLLPPIDFPAEPARCLVTGTGLTHKASAENRNAMHENSGQAAVPLTD